MELFRRMTQGASSSSSSGGGGGSGSLLSSEESQLDELGLNDESSLSILRDALFERFSDLADAQTRQCTLDPFIRDCISRGFPPTWGDAAFRTFENPANSGNLDKFHYSCAIISLMHDEEELLKNQAWLKLRRRVVFKYYDTYNQDLLDLKQFDQFLAEVSQSTSKLQSYGIDISPGEISERDDPTVVSTEALGQSLALCKVQLAERTSELMSVQLQLLQLEKKFCALKLELAEEKAKKS